MSPMRPYVYASTTYASKESVDSATSSSEVMDLSTPVINAENTYQQFYNLNSTLLHDITKLTWLNVSNNTQPSITLNATNTVYQVLLNSVSKIKKTIKMTN